MLTIYHNKMCSKSRQTLDLLQQTGEQVQVVEYLKQPPTADELKVILAKLNLKPQEVIRKGEKLYKEQFEGKEYSDDEWINIMAANPVLIERPIVVKGDKAVIGRPIENVQAIL
ncbi:arsenate reductase (glutaredoxin) [Pontibacter vulgaris]|uniref:arsenate reductase (glutaredoxin) n=1 Tax=Pontibacter vulgaris TaxID=2905679 RepID=UPI001FA7CCEF|nr:arsenate reductase (glutaredoxin) [Pontibacter vulgaris]